MNRAIRRKYHVDGAMDYQALIVLSKVSEISNEPLEALTNLYKSKNFEDKMKMLIEFRSIINETNVQPPSGVAG
jgi:hypothetical protein